MVILNRIYTRTGDDGTTALGSGERRPKYDLRVSAYGAVDENQRGHRGCPHSSCKRRRLSMRCWREFRTICSIWAPICCLPEQEGKSERLRIIPAQIERLEADIDQLNAHSPRCNSFVLPGGTPGAAHLHASRAQSAAGRSVKLSRFRIRSAKRSALPRFNI